MKEEQIKEIIKNRLSNERYYHSICVANQCEILAKQYNINIVNARLVGLVHDIAKELSKEEKINYAIKNNITIDEIETAKNFPTIISLLFIGNVKSVSNVPLSFSPAVVSVAGYVAETVIAIIINKNAYTFM